MIKSRYIALFLLLITASTACKKNKSDDATIQNGKLLSATAITSLTSSQIRQSATVAGFGSFTSFLNYDVDYVKIVYETTYKGNKINASGLLAIPKNMSVSPSLLSAQHGTIFLDSAAPSNFPSTTAMSGFELFASVGFITAIPDFIGFGSSKDVVHPYYDMEHSALAVIDMLKASKTYLKEQQIASSNRLFLMGYSEGGYVTMAAQKEIETHSEHGLVVTASAAGAGGYDLTGMLNAVATATTYNEPSFLAYILNAYNVTNGWNRPLGNFFQAPYASKIPGLLDGTKDKSAINSELSTSPAALFNATFLTNLRVENQETQLKQAFAANSFLNWFPKSRTRLYHGTSDQAVFYQTSETTYKRFIAAGAANTELIPIPGGTHESSIQLMVANALPWLVSLDR